MPKLLSLNVGLPRDMAWRGGTVRTAIWKSPVHGRRFVRRLNIDGNGRGDLAGHGGEHRAVMVYQIDSYRYWEAELNRDDFTFGLCGENFTVEGLGDDEVCIGDRYQIGGALFEVTQPRVTCYRIGIRMEEPACQLSWSLTTGLRDCRRRESHAAFASRPSGSRTPSCFYSQWPDGSVESPNEEHSGAS